MLTGGKRCIAGSVLVLLVLTLLVTVSGCLLDDLYSDPYTNPYYVPPDPGPGPGPDPGPSPDPGPGPSDITSDWDVVRTLPSGGPWYLFVNAIDSAGRSGSGTIWIDGSCIGPGELGVNYDSSMDGQLYDDGTVVEISVSVGSLLQPSEIYVVNPDTGEDIMLYQSTLEPGPWNGGQDPSM